MQLVVCLWVWVYIRGYVHACVCGATCVYQCVVCVCGCVCMLAYTYAYHNATSCELVVSDLFQEYCMCLNFVMSLVL